MTTELENALRIAGEPFKSVDEIKNYVQTNFDEPEVYISDTDKMFDSFMTYLGEHKSGDTSVSISTICDKENRITGAKISISVVI